VHSEPEIIQVLRTAAEDIDAEDLVRWGIPYDRILLIVRELLRTGHLEATGGKVVLTTTGRDRLQVGRENLTNQRIQKRSVNEPVHPETQPVVDYVPPKLID
jgi:hypothetical protein